jgi:hypothetical protein
MPDGAGSDFAPIQRLFGNDGLQLGTLRDGIQYVECRMLVGQSSRQRTTGLATYSQSGAGNSLAFRAYDEVIPLLLLTFTAQIVVA